MTLSHLCVTEYYYSALLDGYLYLAPIQGCHYPKKHEILENVRKLEPSSEKKTATYLKTCNYQEILQVVIDNTFAQTRVLRK